MTYKRFNHMMLIFVCSTTSSDICFIARSEAVAVHGGKQSLRGAEGVPRKGA